MGGKEGQQAWKARFVTKAPEFEARQVVDLDGAFGAFREVL